MAFENLSERLQNAIKMFRGAGKITEDDLKAPLREVRMALLEADVNFKVVKDFIGKVKERALGAEVSESLNPHQQIIKIVNDELIQLLGGTQSKLTVAPSGRELRPISSSMSGTARIVSQRKTFPLCNSA